MKWQQMILHHTLFHTLPWSFGTAQDDMSLSAWLAVAGILKVQLKIALRVIGVSMPRRKQRFLVFLRS